MNRIHALLHTRLLPTLRFRSIVTAGFLFSLAVLVLFQNGSHVKATFSKLTPRAPADPTNTWGWTPSISVVPVLRTAGAGVSNSTIANVSDPEQAASTLIVTVNGGASASRNGVTVNNISVDTAGIVTADVAAAGGSADASFTLTVTDDSSLSATSTLTVMVLLACPGGATWVEQSRPSAGDASAGDSFGTSLAASGDTIVVGAPYDDNAGGTNAGAAYIFKKSGVVWTQQQKLTATDGAPDHLFGAAVGISGDTVIVGRGGDVNLAGFAYIFTRSGSAWTGQQKLVGSDTADGDFFGGSVSISGDTAIIGSSGDSNAGGSGAGSAYVFIRTGSVWTEQQKLTASDGAAFDNLGWSVAISGDTAIAGAIFDSTSAGSATGSAYIFVRNGTIWTEQQKLTASVGAPNERFGASVAISGNTVIVGADRFTNQAPIEPGSAYIFVRNGTVWAQEQKLTASGGGAGGFFGSSVAISGDTVIIGAKNDPLRFNSEGTVYIFVRNGAVWTQTQKLTPSDANFYVYFGASVAISSDTVIVGVPDKRTGAGQNAGLSYIFNKPCGPTCPVTLDPSFDGDGKVVTPLGNPQAEARSVAIQPDGKIVAVGSSFLVRYNVDGTLDTTFGGTGKVTLSSLADASSVAIQTDGKIIAAGSANGFGLTRYNSDGTLDPSFGTAGLVTNPFGGHAELYALALQADGRIVTAGAASNGSNNDFAVARYNQNGTLDATFNGTGKVVTPVGTGSDAARAVAIQPDGMIVAAGITSTGSSSSDTALVRYDSSGALDTTFNGTGKVIVSIGDVWGTDQATSVAIQPDGKIVTAGWAEGFYFALLRFNADGTRDTTWGAAGQVLTVVGWPVTGMSVAQSVHIQEDGRIIVAGWGGGLVVQSILRRVFAVARYNTDGNIDTTFNGNGMVITPVGPLMDYAYSIAVQLDGKIVAAGSTFNGSTSSFALVRYDVQCSAPAPTNTPTIEPTNTPTATSTPTFTPTPATSTPTNTPTATPCSSVMLDPSFGDGGKVITPVGPTTDDAIVGMATQSDGKMVAIGYVRNSGLDWDLATTRYNVDGSLDSTFGTAGLVKTNFYTGGNSIEIGQAVVIQPDGRIVVAGTTQAGGGGGIMARYNSDGSLDTTFGNDGLSGNSGGQITALALQADGKIVAAGFRVPSASFTVIRFNSNGFPDTSFGSSGLGSVNTSIGGILDIAQGVAVQDDGRIVVVGSSKNATDNDFAAVRFNADGSLDTTFGNGGKVVTPIGNSDDVAKSVGVQGDGKIVVSGFSQNETDGDMVVLRYNPDGTLDTSFGTGGKVSSPVGSSLYQVTVASMLQPDGKILVAGSNAFGSGYMFAVLRYNSDGSPDTTFGTSGKITVPIRGYALADSIVVQPDNRIVVGGGSNAGQGFGSDFTLIRLGEGGCSSPTPTPTATVANSPTNSPTPTNTPTIMPTVTPTSTPTPCSSSGTLDTSFDGDGKVILPVGSLANRANSIVVQTDGKIVAAGDRQNGVGPDFSDFALARFDPNGSLDTTFDRDGIVTTNFSSHDHAQSAAIQADGKIVLAGYVDNGSSSDLAVVRYNTDGSLDTTFDGDGKVTTDIQGSTDQAFSTAIQSDGKLVVVGSAGAGAGFAIVRYNTNGSLDTTFDGDGKVTTSFGFAQSGAIQPDGKIVIAGYGNTGLSIYFVIARYNTDGSPDPTFDGDGKVTTTVLGAVDRAYSVAIQPDGKIVAAGLSVNGLWSDLAVVRYNADGSLDTTFDGDGKVTTDITTFDDVANSVLVQPDGKIVATGNGGSGSGGGTYPDFAVARYNADGSLDTSFDGDGKVTTNVLSSDSALSAALQADGKIVVGGYSSNAPSGLLTIVRYGEPCASSPTNTPTSTPTVTPTDTPTNTPTNTPTPPPNITGTVTYANDQIAGPSPRFVGGVSIDASGSAPVSATTGTDGTYSLTGFAAGAYTVTPSKPGGHNQYVTSFDAALIARYAAGAISFNAAQLAASDVSGNGSVTSFDAGMVANYAVSQPQRTGLTGTWTFSPANRSYASVTTAITGEDYAAMLMGEVSGNWTNTGLRPGASRQLLSAVAGQSGSGSSSVRSEKDIAITASRLVTPADSEFMVPVRVEGAINKGIISYEFDLRYDPAVLQPLADPVDIAGTVSRALSVAVNSEEPGLLKVAVYGPMPISGDGVLLGLRFAGIGAAGSVSQLRWERIVFNEGGSQTTATDGQVELSAATPTQAEISGRVLTTMGQGVPHTRVTLTDSTGQTTSVLSNGFGVYRFGGLQVGQTYTIRAASRSFAFAPLTVSSSGQLTSADMIAEH